MQALDQASSLEEAKKLGKAILANQTKIKKPLDNLNDHTMHAIKVLNYNYTSTTRKRKQDVTNGLGPSFKVYAQDTDHGEYLFNMDIMKAMKSELKHIKPKDEAKNASHSTKPHWSGHQGNRSRNSSGSSKPKFRKQSYNNYHNNNKNNNYHNNNNNNQKYKGKKH